jgi:hypothetical protein
MTKLAIARKALAVIAIWLVTIPLLGILVSADDWFWYHYIGTMPVDTYRFIKATLGVCSFVGSILLLVGAVTSSAYVLGFRPNPAEKSAA